MAAFLSDVWKKLDTVKQNVVGPSYSYTDRIKSASDMGVGDNGDFGQLATNVRAGFQYVDYLIGKNPPGGPLGNRFFVATGGSCINSKGQIKDRYNYIDNVPSGTGVTGMLFGKGLLSGTTDDVYKLGTSPVYIMRGMTADATPACDLYKCQVTDYMNGDTQYVARGMTPDYRPDLCTKIQEGGDPDADARSRVDQLTSQVNSQKQLVAKNPQSKELKKTLNSLQDQLDDAVEELKGLPERRNSRRYVAGESFTLMNTPSFGTLLLAALGVAALVFSKRR